MLLRSFCIVLTSTTLLAQSYSPAHFANAEGPLNNVVPFGSSVPIRYSQIHDDVPAMVITGMAFRHDYYQFTTLIYPPYTLTMDAWMSTAVTPSSGMNTTFDLNHGPDKTQVVTNRTYTLPPSDPSNLPGQFVLDFPFDVPFTFSGSPASLCWEVQITTNTATTSIAYDAVQASSFTSGSNPAMAIGAFGVGCFSSGAVNTMTATATQFMNWSQGVGRMTTSGTDLLPNGITVFATGADKTQGLGVPLPFTLPGTSCTVYNDVIVSAVVIADASGTGSNMIQFVPLPAYNGLTFYTQIWGLDPTANPFGLTTSNAAMHHIVSPYTAPLPVSRVFLNSLGPTGSRNTSYGLITKFY
jgi:hypothetical protein